MVLHSGHGDNCNIHCNHKLDPCIECQGNLSVANKAECTVAWGTCNHAFHYHCLSQYLETRSNCPLDNLKRNYKKYGH